MLLHRKRIIFALLATIAVTSEAFLFNQQNSLVGRRKHLLYQPEGRDDNERDPFSRELAPLLTECRKTVMEEEFRRPPNAELSSQETVLELLNGLWKNSDPLPDSGFRSLLRASTPKWRKLLYDSVAAPESANEEVVVAALGEAMGRPDNQFAILVGESERYVASFPMDPVDYYDGTVWLECRLSDISDDTLFAVTGWQLEQNADGAWLVDRIDWQDFRGT
jgi:hypothetical protein